MKILLVEDDASVAQMLRQHLEAEGYFVHLVSDGSHALRMARQLEPDLILLDRVLPGASGDEILRRLRADPRTEHVPVIMLTGKGEESDELVGLALGADDYISKPFSPKRLLARIAARLRRSAAALDETPSPQSITLDRKHPRVLLDNTAVQLTAAEYRILATLIAARGHILRREQLAAAVYGKDRPPDESVLEEDVATLRRKMGAAARYIQAIAANGFAFCDPGMQPPPT